MRLVLLLLLFRSLTASPACKSMPCLLACFGDLYIYSYTVFQCSAPKYPYAYSVVYSYNRISGKLTATIVNLINFLGGWLAYEYTDRLTAVDIHRGGTIK